MKATPESPHIHGTPLSESIWNSNRITPRQREHRRFDRSWIQHGQPPSLPGGVLDYVRQRGEDRLSWQPEPGTRYAAVVERVTAAQPGFVLVARSLRETERRIGVVQSLALVGWLALLAASLVAVVLVEIVLPAPKSK